MIKFALRNEYNQEYELNTDKTHYMPNPSGLGYEMDTEYTRIGTSWVAGSTEDSQAEISGEVYFKSSECFKEFSNFAKFIRTASTLKFVYQNDVGEYIKDVSVRSIEHAGLVGHNTLKCTLTMIAKSLWYSNNVTNYRIDTVSGETMRYPYKLPARFKGNANGTIEVTNDGSVEAPFTASFIGAIVNPTLILCQDEEEVARIEIIGEAFEGESIELSTVDGDLYCYRKRMDENVSLVSDLDISNNNFFKLPIGTSTITLSADSDITHPVIFTVKKLYRAV